MLLCEIKGPTEAKNSSNTFSVSRIYNALQPVFYKIKAHHGIKLSYPIASIT